MAASGGSWAVLKPGISSWSSTWVQVFGELSPKDGSSRISGLAWKNFHADNFSAQGKICWKSEKEGSCGSDRRGFTGGRDLRRWRKWCLMHPLRGGGRLKGKKKETQWATVQHLSRTKGHQKGGTGGFPPPSWWEADNSDTIFLKVSTQRWISFVVTTQRGGNSYVDSLPLFSLKGTGGRGGRS